MEIPNDTWTWATFKKRKGHWVFHSISPSFPGRANGEIAYKESMGYTVFTTFFLVSHADWFCKFCRRIQFSPDINNTGTTYFVTRRLHLYLLFDGKKPYWDWIIGNPSISDEKKTLLEGAAHVCVRVVCLQTRSSREILQGQSSNCWRYVEYKTESSSCGRISDS